MAVASNMRIIDGDGHVLEDLKAIAGYLPKEWANNVTTRTLGVFRAWTICTMCWRRIRRAPLKTPALTAGRASRTHWDSRPRCLPHGCAGIRQDDRHRSGHRRGSGVQQLAERHVLSERHTLSRASGLSQCRIRTRPLSSCAVW